MINIDMVKLFLPSMSKDVANNTLMRNKTAKKGNMYDVYTISISSTKVISAMSVNPRAYRIITAYLKVSYFYGRKYQKGGSPTSISLMTLAKSPPVCVPFPFPEAT